MPSYPHPDTLTQLTTDRPDSPVVSLYLDTDPRKPENASDNPAWLVELRNGLREVGEAIEAEGDRDTTLAWREASEQIEEEVRELTPAQRGRSLAIFRNLDDSYHHRVASQLSLGASRAVWNERPYIAPLVELVDRGRAIAIVLLDNDEMSVLRWWDGRIVDGTETGVESDLDAWRSGRGGSEGGHLPRLRTHEQQVDARADEHSQRFLADAAAQFVRALPDLDVDSIVIAHAPGSLTAFVEALPQDVQEKVATTIDAQITGEDAHAVGERLADE
ncbi:MAG: VLRF1 family aeRF1-type release factor, partial [Propionibacteriaceae bacterium]|nr:VLRF1 family aeRF1-type release factor [Propionibacteriaceae bacterium]